MEKELGNNFEINGKYKINERIGHGGFGIIYLVNRKEDGKKYALKVLSEEKNSEKNLKDFEHEIGILKKLYKMNQLYVLKLYDSGIFFTYDKMKRNYFIVDFAEKGDLCRYLKDRIGFGEDYAKIIFKKILEGMKYCHSENICHLDLKDANILLDDKYNPIINDFGLSQNIYDQDGQINKMTGKIGTPYIRCPEMFEEQVYYNGIDADIFSLGVLLFKLVFGIRGFLNAEHHSYNDIKNKNYEHYWERFKKSIEVRQLKLSPEFKNLYLRMVAYESSERPRIDEILNDPWLGEINNWLQNDINKYKALEKKFNDHLNAIEQKIKDKSIINIKPPENPEEAERGTKSFSPDENNKYYNKDLLPKKLTIKRNFKDYVIIKGYFNASKANKFMDSLVIKIIDKYRKKLYIKASKYELKFTIEFKKEKEIDEEEKEEEEKMKDEKEEEEEEEEIVCIMEANMYECNENEFILSFEKIKGDLEVFYDNILKIKKIIEEMFFVFI